MLIYFIKEWHSFLFVLNIKLLLINDLLDILKKYWSFMTHHQKIVIIKVLLDFSKYFHK
jgi:hypothetical protein